jgi:ATP-binding cassette subfamily C protein/ATP-binding cassette subfamily C protein LapB
VIVIQRADDGSAQMIDAGRQSEIPPGTPIGAGTAYTVDRAPAGDPANEGDGGGSFASFTKRLRGSVARLLVLSFFGNVIALSVPLFTMAVYDHVIGKQSAGTLPYLVIGIVALLLWELGIRHMRAKLMGYIGGRLDFLVSTSGFSQLLHLPTAYTDRASIGSQLSRMREFEAIREFFASPIATAMLDLPFALILIAGISFIAWPLAVVPAVIMVVLAIATFASGRLIADLSRQGSMAQAARHSFLVEMIARMRAIKTLGAEETWLDRFRHQSAEASLRGSRARFATAVLQTVGQVSVVVAGTSTLLVGTHLVLAGELSVGGLVACLAITWRALAPIVTLISTASRIGNVKNAIRRFDNLMRIEPERVRAPNFPRTTATKGAVSFARVSLRYAANAEPALLGVSFDAAPGQMIVVIGPTGSGKSSVLKLIAGLYTPQGGSVSIDGVDIRQMDLIQLRQTIAYVPQYNDLFYGTIAQNLRLSKADASDEELWDAADAASIKDQVAGLPEQLETRLGDNSTKHLSTGFHRGLSLARAYLRNAPVILLDEPADGLDDAADEAFMTALRSLAGKATIIMTTHRPSHMSFGDTIVYLKEGRPEAVAPAAAVLKALKMGKAA